MTEYAPPLKDMRFVIHHLSGLEGVLQLPEFSAIDIDTVDQVLEEAGKFARDVLAPLNIPGDRAGCRVENNAVIVADGFADAYQQFVENGWQSLPVPDEYGGMAFPEIIGAAAVEMWQAANMSLSLCPLLTAGAIVAIEKHGSDALKQKFLPNMISGTWSGTMNLTESHAGSDLAAVTTKAVADGDQYRITGTKIFITWGDHSMSENIVHLVLARIEGAPDGIRGLSLFAVPKYKVNEDGSLGDRNDLYPASVEHKLGIHASPTCVMNYGENGGAIGHVIGEENKGLACMFSMMNHARLNVGIQGLSLSERAYQLARVFALERVQGETRDAEGRVTLIKHADVRRMLMLMKVQIEAMRAAAFVTASQLDFGHHGMDEEGRESANVRMALLTPIIKGWLTEVAQEVTSVGLQIHGGMGFLEETGAVQHLRDARILPIYEGTTGIQANDLVGRKILADGGQAMAALIADMREVVLQLDGESELEAIRGSLGSGIDQLEEAVDWLISNSPDDYNVPGAASVNLLMLAGVVVGGWQMARAGLAVSPDSALAVSDPKFCAAKRISVAFYAAHILPRSYAYLRATTAGTSVIMTMPENSF